jgi:hypothetical protein
MRTIEQVLSHHPYCPVCKSRDRDQSNLKSTGSREDKKGSNFYLDVLFKSAGIDVGSALDRMTLWECRRCQTLWYDPWLTLDFIASGYGYLAGRHQYGWAALRAYNGNWSYSYTFSHRRIVDLLLALLPVFSRYAEVNCPFSGILFEIQKRRISDFDKAKAVLAQKINTLRKMYGANSLQSEYSVAEDWSQLTVPSAQGPLAALERVLIDAPSPMYWGRSCNFSGANCHAVARDLFVDAVMDFESVGSQQNQFDAMGLFLTLDHFVDPMRVLNQALSLSEIVVISTHPWGWTAAQHFYNFGLGISDIIRAQGASVVDISTHVTERSSHGDRDRYFLISRSRDLTLDISRATTDGALHLDQD